MKVFFVYDKDDESNNALVWAINPLQARDLGAPNLNKTPCGFGSTRVKPLDRTPYNHTLAKAYCKSTYGDSPAVTDSHCRRFAGLR